MKMKLIHQEVSNCTRCPFVDFSHKSAANLVFGDKAREKDKKDKNKPIMGEFIFKCNHKKAPINNHLGKVKPDKLIDVEDMEVEFPEWCPLDDTDTRPTYQCYDCERFSHEIKCSNCGSSHALFVKE
jgi:hypothetical protein